jgi:hypothetical protein
MAVKFPIEYELTPTELRTGTRWMTLKLENIGTETSLPYTSSRAKV